MDLEEWTVNALKDIEEESRECDEEYFIEIDGLFESLSEVLHSVPIDSLLTVIPAKFDPSIHRIVIDAPGNIASLLSERLFDVSINRSSPSCAMIDQEALIQRYDSLLEQLLYQHAAILNIS